MSTASLDAPALSPQPLKTQPAKSKAATGGLCTTIPWALLVIKVSPYVKKYTIELAQLAVTNVKKMVASGNCNVTGGCTSAFPSCCATSTSGSGGGSTKPPGYVPAPGGNKKNQTGNGINNDVGSVIDYPTPFKEDASVKRLSFISPSGKRVGSSIRTRYSHDRKSLIPEPIPFE